MPNLKPLYEEKPASRPTIVVYPDGFLLRDAAPSSAARDIPFDQVQAMARLQPINESFGDWSVGKVSLAVYFEGEWVRLPAIPGKLVDELEAQAPAAGIEIVGWPMELSGQGHVSLGPIVVREYANVRDFELDAKTMDMAGYDIISTTQQEQRSSAMTAFLAGPLWANAAKPKAHIVVTYKRRAAPASA